MCKLQQRYSESRPDKPGKLAQCIPIYGTILGQCTRNRANAESIFLVSREASVYNNGIVKVEQWDYKMQGPTFQKK